MITLLAGAASAQDRTLPEEDWYGDVKRVLMNHYTGKIVRTRLPIPATRRGLELVDGSVKTLADKTPVETAAQMGEELTIKSFRVTDNNIEVLFAKSEPPPKKKVPNPFSAWKQPRINLRFSRELAAKDLTIENINRMLASAVEVAALVPATPDPAAQTAIVQSATPPAPQSAASRREEAANTENIPTPQIVSDLPTVGTGVGELTIESSTKQARVYIDGAFSGPAPRTVRLRAGVHTILVVSDGYASWEQRLFIPGAKLSLVRAELQK
ncbi:MAG: PEGA domain-containing protein [Blastocatellia bacterium]|nr:PEGA domain-containing protein [Blastocatellia bacterium]